MRSRGGSSPKNLVSLRTRPGWVRDGTESRKASNSLAGRWGRSARPGEVRSCVSSDRILSSSWGHSTGSEVTHSEAEERAEVNSSPLVHCSVMKLHLSILLFHLWLLSKAIPPAFADIEMGVNF